MYLLYELVNPSVEVMDRPYIIIHTHTSLDGNIDTIDAPGFHHGSEIYQRLALGPERKLEIQAYTNGKNSTQVNITGFEPPTLDPDAPEVPAGDFWAEDADVYYISFDPRGELAFPTTSLHYGGVDAHFVEVLTEDVGNPYRHYLREKGISYVIAGRNRIDYPVLLTTLKERGIGQLMIGGGGTINYSFLQQRLVDEVSLVMSPAANGDPFAARFFTAREPYSTVEGFDFTLKDVRDMGDSVVWLRYTPNYQGK